MDQIKRKYCSYGLVEKRAYEPPRSMRLDDVGNGAGACDASGSGDRNSCSSSGNIAFYSCSSYGNNVQLPP
jgi:hypothetical protein